MSISAPHEALIELFRQRPQLAFEVVPALRHPAGPVVELAASATDAKPLELRADLVLRAGEGEDALGIVVEAQLRPDDEKAWTWPAYLAALRHRHRHGFTLVVVTLSTATAMWARRPIDTGHPGWALVPLVIGPDDVPVVIDAERARADPELAVLSTLAHGRGPSAERVGRAALIAVHGMDGHRGRLYTDLVIAALGRLAQPILGELVQQGYVYQSDFAKQYVAEGRVEGRAEGRVEGRVEGLLEAVRENLSARFPRANFAPELAALAGADADVLRAALRVPLQVKDLKTARAQLAALVAPKR